MDPRDEWRNPDTEALFEAVLTLEDTDEVARFFRDLLTFNELTELGQRWAIVRKLEEGAARFGTGDLSYRVSLSEDYA